MHLHKTCTYQVVSQPSHYVEAPLVLVLVVVHLLSVQE